MRRLVALLGLVALAGCTQVLGDYTASPSEDAHQAQCREVRLHIENCLGQAFIVKCENVNDCLANCILSEQDCNVIKDVFVNNNVNNALGQCGASCPAP